MVRFLKRGNSLERLVHGRSMRQPQSPGMEGGGGGVERSSEMEERTTITSMSQGTVGAVKHAGYALERSDRAVRSPLGKDGRCSSPSDRPPSEIEMMKERFAKLLLGEDMSGGGKGVSSALALSNAITNLAASVFGEQWRLEPMSLERKARWRREIDWLLSVTDYIVEFVPSQQKSKDGTNMEIMVTRQRNDLHMNIPALRKLDAMLIDYLDNFKDQNEFWYGTRDEQDGEEGARRKDDKWWLPKVKVPPHGLSEVSRKWLQFQKESVNQVLKAAMAINAQIISEMEIPEAYVESLPKNGRASLGESIYRSITLDYFDPEQFFQTVDISTEHLVMDLKNRIEASIVIWKRKMTNKDGRSSWGSAVSLEKREVFEERAQTILLMLKHRFPGTPQSSLDISKIQYNRVSRSIQLEEFSPLWDLAEIVIFYVKDVGQAVLESYSRILESLAFTVMSRIEDVLYADSLARDPSLGEAKARTSSPAADPVKLPGGEEEAKRTGWMETPTSMTLSDFMGWHLDQETESDKKQEGGKQETANSLEKAKPADIVTTKKFSYIEKLENLGGLRSPTARH